MNHCAWTNEETVVQLRGMGPWGMTYVNSEDDPRQMTCERSASGLRSMSAALGEQRLRHSRRRCACDAMDHRSPTRA
jgi:hypothetical protein